MGRARHPSAGGWGAVCGGGWPHKEITRKRGRDTESSQMRMQLLPRPEGGPALPVSGSVLGGWTWGTAGPLPLPFRHSAAAWQCLLHPEGHGGS